MKKHVYLFVIASLAVLGVASFVMGYSGEAPKVVVEGNYIEASDTGGGDVLGAVSSPELTSEYFCYGGLCNWIKKGDMIDASTTLVSVANPFSGTSTVDLIQLDITGVATSTYSITCGESITAYSTNLYSILSSGSISTSTNPGRIENNLTNSYGGELTGGTVAKMAVGPGDYVVCKATIVAAYAGGLTNAVNTQTGKFTVRFYQ